MTIAKENKDKNIKTSLDIYVHMHVVEIER